MAVGGFCGVRACRSPEAALRDVHAALLASGCSRDALYIETKCFRMIGATTREALAAAVHGESGGETDDGAWYDMGGVLYDEDNPPMRLKWHDERDADPCFADRQ